VNATVRGTVGLPSVCTPSSPTVVRVTPSLEHWNEHHTPFVWTKDPADIIKKAVRRGR